MNQAKLYERANSVQRHDAQQIIKEFAGVFQWRLDGKDSLIDVGCGSGDVLMDFVYPILPKGFGRIVGTDVSQKMIRHGKKTYSQMDRVDFKVLDIATDTLPNEFVCEFDHVTSFYCLHWIQNQRQAVENIYKMLHNDGDCLLVFLATNPIFEVYRILSKSAKWTPYMKDVKKYISPLQYSKDPGTEFGQILEDVGFIDYSVEMRDKMFTYEGLETLKKNVTAVNPFLERMPTWMHEDFLDEFVTASVGLNLTEKIADRNDYRFIIPYKLAVVYARK